MKTALNRSKADSGLRPADIEVRDTGTERGRGVFALRSFKKGELVEVAPVLVLKTDFEDLPQLLRTYVFDWETLTGITQSHAVALGFGSMYNHSNPSNLVYKADGREGVMRYFAARAIRAGTELTINYNAMGGSPVCEDNNWFDRHDIRIIES